MTQYLPYTAKEYRALLCRELREYESEIGDMTADELSGLRKWVADGNSPYANPCLIYDDDGRIIDYIQAVRIEEVMLKNPDDYMWWSEQESDDSEDDIPF